MNRIFEIHTRQWDCGSRHYSVACTCGVAAREGNDVVTFDMCDGQLQETQPRVSLKTLRVSTTNQIKIHETHQGKKITVGLYFTCYVRLHFNAGTAIVKIIECLQVLIRNNDNNPICFAKKYAIKICNKKTERFFFQPKLGKYKIY